ncbi:hypothetical protein WP50_28280 [Lactiplantibacillus plantarum]|nr:hypothetical protein WP50_28280 [Lactiplantibacillus plantarum]
MYKGPHLISWSRSYIGPAPVMTYLANQDIGFVIDQMSAEMEISDGPTIVTNQTLSVLALVQVLNAFYAQTPFIGTVTCPRIRSGNCGDTPDLMESFIYWAGARDDLFG